MAPTRTGAVIQCQECGKELYLSPKELVRRKYCSRTCQSVAIARTRRTACVQCGKEFGQSPSVGGKYCSRACYEAGRQRRTTCAVCEKPLQPHELTYCSQACMSEGRRTLEQKPCEICGTPMAVQPHQFGIKRFCSKACHNESKRIPGPGARMKRSDGYMQVYYPKHPDTTSTGMMLEHRLVAEQKYGRRILQTEHVHHLNGDRSDNRPENLEVIDPGAHARVSSKAGVAQRKALRAKLAEYEKRFGPLDG
jgi:hypothetical protein